MNVLIIRFSAMGDVLMTIPVIHSVATAHPDTNFWVLTKSSYAEYLGKLPSNASIIPVDFQQYKGLWGLIKLYKSLLPYRFEAIVDLHDVLRTKVVRWLFKLQGVKAYKIDKGKAERKRILSRKAPLEPLKTMFERYREVFARAGFDAPLVYKHPHHPLMGCIGVAPFAAHESKIYPAEKMRQVIQLLSACGYSVYLFGSAQEKDALVNLKTGLTNVYISDSSVSKWKEMKLISSMQLMITMDSSNMHLASLLGVPVLSIWGPTHPYLGYLGWGQKLEHVMQVNLPCRPCSVYGEKPCKQGNLLCMNNIKPNEIVQKALNIIHDRYK